jgi:5'-nucleotidase
VKAGVETASMLAVSAGFTYTWDAAKPVGSRVDPALMKLDGAAIRPTGAYRVVASQFLAEGAILEDGTDRQSGTTEIDALVSDLGASARFDTPATDRIVRLH